MVDNEDEVDELEDEIETTRASRIEFVVARSSESSSGPRSSRAQLGLFSTPSSTFVTGGPR
jgi:hypothetical protein